MRNLETTQGCYCHLRDFAPVLIINWKRPTTVLQTVVRQADSDPSNCHDNEYRLIALAVGAITPYKQSFDHNSSNNHKRFNYK